MYVDTAENARSAQALRRRTEARRELVTAVLASVAQEYEPSPREDLIDLYHLVDLAARNLTRAVDLLPVDQQPVGWAL